MTTESTGFELVPYAAPVPTSAPVTVAIGHLGERIYFDAYPNDGTIGVSADYGTELTFDVPEFALIAELLVRAAMAD